MALKNETNINAGDQSTNNQAQTINNHYSGLTYSDAKELWQDLFERNFIVLKEEAAKVAGERAKELNDKLLRRLENESQNAFEEFATPGMQNSLFNAQKEYAMNGDEDIADMLVEILIQRSKNPQKDRTRMVLDESLQIAPKLTTHQLNLLSITHIARKTHFTNQLNLGQLVSIMRKFMMPINEIDISQVNDDISILQYLGLGIIHTGNYTDPILSLTTTYPTYFNNGFALEDIQLTDNELPGIVIRCFHDEKKFQLGFVDTETLDSDLRDRHFTNERIVHIKTFFNKNLLSQEQLKTFCEDKLPEIIKSKEMFDKTQWKSFELTHVGTAIALSNLHRVVGEKIPMSIWIK